MIVLYAVWIAVDADGNPASVLVDAPLEYQIPEHVFCTYFFVEWFIRCLANQGPPSPSSLRTSPASLAPSPVHHSWVVLGTRK